VWNPLPGARESTDTDRSVRVKSFGATSLRVSEFGLGCARIGGIFQGDSRGFLRLLSAALDRGINFFDTADMYAQGESEALLGKAFRAERSRVVLASKAGFCLPGRRRLAARLKPLLRPAIRALGLRRDRIPVGARGALTQDFSPAYLRKAVEASLRRLRTDYLDLFQLHSPPADVVKAGAWQPALEALKRAGKIRYYGISCDTVDAARAALQFPEVSSLQFLVNLLERRAVESFLPEMRAHGVAGIARECLANGLLAKSAEQVDLALHYPATDERMRREAEMAAYRRQAAESGRSLAQMALDYVASLDGVSVTLVGARTVDQLQTLLGETSRPEAS
jgi:aryl-alcohol dehydrogenase-like predicted oxidoreductase